MISLFVGFALLLTGEPYSVRCLVEIAEHTGQRDLLRDEHWRSAARAKARVLDQLTDQWIKASIASIEAARALEREQRDLYENDLISEAEWTETQQIIREHNSEIRERYWEMIDKYPSCDFRFRTRGLGDYEELRPDPPTSSIPSD